METKELTKVLKKWKRNKDCPDTLDLSGKKLGNSHVHLIEEALRRNTYIKVLALSANHIGDEGGLSLAKLLTQNTSLTDLDISFNELTEKSIGHIFQAVKANSKILNLNLLGNDCSAQVENELQNILAGRRPIRPLVTAVSASTSSSKISSLVTDSGPLKRPTSISDVVAASHEKEEQSGGNSSATSKDSFSISALNRRSTAPAGNTQTSSSKSKKKVKEKKYERGTHFLAFDELDMKFQDMMNTFYREYSDLKEVTNSLEAKRQLLEQECNSLQMKSVDLQRTVATLESQIASEQSTLKRFRQLRQEIVKKPIAIDLSNVVVSTSSYSCRFCGSFSNKTYPLIGPSLKLQIGEPLAVLGGSSAEVLVARVDGWKCAVKKMDLNCCSDAEIQSFRREIAILERLPAHPNICRYLFHTELADRHLAVFMTEYETTLRSLLNKAKQPLGKSVILKYSQDIVEGLDFLHSNEIIHRDLKVLHHLFALLLLLVQACTNT